MQKQLQKVDEVWRKEEVVIEHKRLNESEYIFPNILFIKVAN